VKQWSWLLACCLFAGCAGTETGNPSFDGALGYDAYSSAPRVALQQSELSARDPVTDVQATWLVLGDVSFLGDAHCETARPVAAPAVPGLGADDHVGSQAQPTPFELGSGYYCGVRLPLLQTESVPGAPSELTGHSLMLAGQLEDGRAFELLSRWSDVLVLRAQQGFQLDAAQPDVLIGFDLAHWLDGLDWNAAQIDDSGKIVVDDTHNTELLSAFEQRLPGGVALFRDSDGDGMLDHDPVELARGSD
jgi:hypothetical protein